MTDKEKKPMPTTPIFYDSYGIEVCECPHCRFYKPNVGDMQVIQCEGCKKTYVATF